uniref:STAS domain-containing protein n=1 Tax=uncultured Anaerovibrio sp. TaxID=361586 RepID=UPI0025DE60C8
MNNSVLVIPLEGKIDSLNAADVGRDIAKQRAEQEYQALIFDAKKLKFISSAGLRIIMQVIKEEKVKKHERVSMIEVGKEVYNILEMTGFTELMVVQKAYREISLEGSELIAEGFFGKVYRLDEETIVKVYGEGEVSIPLIQREQSRARKAFVKGIPTAIAYDIVRVGSQYGSVFELLQARSFNDWAQEYEQDKEQLDELMRLYVDCLKQVHATEMAGYELPMARDNMLESLSALEGCLPAEILGRL